MKKYEHGDMVSIEQLVKEGFVKIKRMGFDHPDMNYWFEKYTYKNKQTNEVYEVLRQSGMKEGYCKVYR